MHVTLLGSGEAVGQPAPLCDCEYCETGPRRRRPSLLVETDAATVVLDAGPDLPEQLRETGTTAVDAFFVTHHHFDHVGGLHELNHAAMGFDYHVGVEQGHLDPDPFDPAAKPRDPAFAVYVSERCLAILRESTPHLTSHLNLRTMESGAGVEVGDLRVVPFPVDHGRPTFDTLGFRVEKRVSGAETGEERTAGAEADETASVVYAPDLWEFMDDRAYADADLLVAEGAALFRAFGHGTEADLREALADAAADRTVLVNLSEHLQRMTTDEMRAVATEDGYELGRDFATYEV